MTLEASQDARRVGRWWCDTALVNFDCSMRLLEGVCRPIAVKVENKDAVSDGNPFVRRAASRGGMPMKDAYSAV